MSDTSKILVTGASGQLGRRAVELLLERGASVIATTRTPDRLADLAARPGEGRLEVRAASFDDEGGLAAAFRGAQRALLVSTDAIDVPGKRLAQQRRAVAALEAAGVEHVVYTSLPNADRSVVTFAPDHAGTEAAIAASKLGYTVLRNFIYLDFTLFGLADKLASGKLIDARGDGATAFVTREDCARVAAAAVADPARNGRETLDVTGAEALTSAAFASLVSELSGKPLVHVNVPVEALVDGMVEHGLPRPVAEVYASIDVAISRGEGAKVTDVVRALTGRDPETARAFLERHRGAFG